MMLEVGQLVEIVDPVEIGLDCGEVTANQVVEVKSESFSRYWFDDELFYVTQEWVDKGFARIVASAPDENGWRQWFGGPCPVNSKTRVEYKCQSGNPEQVRAGWCYWDHKGLEGDIVAFRIHKLIEDENTIEPLIGFGEPPRMPPVKPAKPEPTAQHIVQQALKHMEDRAETYDNPEGERSIGATVEAFNAVTDGKMDTEEKGWLFLVLLKIVRSQQGNFKLDNYEDLSAYGALMGEAAYKERGGV